MERARSLCAREVRRRSEELDELTRLIRSIGDRWIEASEMRGAHLAAMG